MSLAPASPSGTEWGAPVIITRNSSDKPRLPRQTAKALSFVFVTVLALIWLVPIIMMLVVSFMPPEQRAPRFGGLLISGVSVQNYVTVFEDAEIVRHFINSVAVTVPSVILVVIISSLAAFALARLKFFARDISFYLLIMTLMLPIPTLVVPIFQINKALGLTDRYLGLILPYTALGVPFAIVILRSFFAGFPHRDRGGGAAGWLQPLRNLLAHHDAGQLACCRRGHHLAIHDLLERIYPRAGHDEFGGGQAVDAGAAGVQRAIYDAPGPMFAILTLITLPVIVVYYLMQRFMVSGLTAGAVRG